MNTLRGVPVVSRLLPQAKLVTPKFAELIGMPELIGRPACFLAMATSVGGKLVFTGIGVGRSVMTLTPVGKGAFEVGFQYASGRRVHVVECPDVATARERAESALFQAMERELVFMVCANSTVYDAVTISQLFGLEVDPFDLPADVHLVRPRGE